MPAPSPDVDDDVRTSRSPDRQRRRRRSRRSWAKRRHLGWITFGGALLVLVVGLVVVVTTWDHGVRPLAAAVVTSTAPRSTAPAPSVTTSAPAAGATMVRGTIDSVGDSRYTMTTSTDESLTVVVTATTKFQRARHFDSYEPGDRVIVSGSLDGTTLTATTIAPDKSK